MANNNQEDDNITVSKIYETLKSGPFLKKLYWDVLSDIKEKDTFKQMKETTEKLLNKKSETLTNLSDSDADTLQRKKIVTEICSMTFAVDTVFSKIMFIKLQKEFKSHIIESIKDLRKEKKIPDSVWSKLQIAHDPVVKDSLESSAGKSNAPQQIPEPPSRPVRNQRHKMTPLQIAAKNNEIRSEIHKDLKAINSEENKAETFQKRLRPKNQDVPKKQIATSVKSIPKKKQTEEKQISSKSGPHLKNTEVKAKPNSFFRNTEEVKITPEGKLQSEEDESDTNSIISVGHVSVASVSSVHTSDLSSFDDEISLSSEDEELGIKRRVSLKELKKICSDGKLPEKLNGSILKNLPGTSKENSTKSPASSDKQQNEVTLKKNAVASNKPQIEESSKKKAVTNNKQQIEESSKKKAMTNNKQQLEEISKKKAVTNNKQQIEENSKRKSASSNKLQEENSKKNAVTSNKQQIEESSKKSVSVNNKQQIEESSKKNAATTNKQQLEESSKKNAATTNKQQLEDNSKKSFSVNNKQQIESSPDNTRDSTDSSPETKSYISKTLPKRIRKPNSRYSSDIILCTITKVKERKKQTSVENDKSSSNVIQPNKKRTRNNSSDSHEDTPSKNLKTVPIEENETKPFLNTPKHSSSSEMFRPHFPIRSLTSRKTAPLTLYST